MSKSFKLISALLIVIFINLLFSIKYLPRYSEAGIYFGFAIMAIQLLALFFFSRGSFSWKTVKYSSFAITLLLACFAVVTHYIIDPASTNVDRWSVINAFFSELMKGNYPYYAKSNMDNYPGPMPFYFLISAPFYFLGELNFLSLAGYVILFLMVVKNSNKIPETGVVVFLLASSLFVYWEIAVRSNIFSFSLLILLGIKLFLSIDKNRYNSSFFFSAILTGLLLSTRSIFILPLIVVFLSALIRKDIRLKSLVFYGTVSFFSFLVTFLPLFLFFRKDFLIMNPFIVQSSFLIPAGYVVVFIAISIILSLLVKSKPDNYFYSGLSLFIAIAIYFSYQIVLNGFEKAFLRSNADISYFLFCLPFLLYFIIEKNTVRLKE